MSEMTRVKGVVETVIADDHFVGADKMVADGDTGTKLSKAAMKAFRRAKKVSESENARARAIVSALRAKRECVAEGHKMTDTTHTSMGEQATLFDF